MGQLAIDALLASTKAEFVTGIYHPAILPMVGSDPLDLKYDRLMTALELFKTEKEAILQLRSGLVPGQRDEFLNDLFKWISQGKFAKLVILSSTDSEERLDGQIQGSQFRFVSKAFNEELV